MTSGACLVVAVQRDNAVLAFEALLGRCVFVDVKLTTSSWPLIAWLRVSRDVFNVFMLLSLSVRSTRNLFTANTMHRF